MNLTEAFDFASRCHPGQLIYHPMAVASLVLRHGGSEAQAKAALLHDTIAGGRVTPAQLAERFDPEVARLVSAFADPLLPAGAEPTWKESKDAYLAQLAGLDDACLMVVACEELQVGTELLQDLRYQGAAAWKRHPVHAMELFWYYRELLRIFVRALPGERYRGLVGEYGAFVRALQAIVFENAPT